MIRKAGMGCLATLFALTACNAPTRPTSLRLTDLPVSQLQSMQTRDFNQPDIHRAMQATLKSLLLLDFQIVRIDDQIGLVEAIRLYQGGITQTNVILQKLDNNKIRIRITLRYDQSFLTAEKVYQDFFESLNRFMSY